MRAKKKKTAKKAEPKKAKAGSKLSPETLHKMSLACKRRWKAGIYDGLRASRKEAPTEGATVES